jgi:hypothetical protein
VSKKKGYSARLLEDPAMKWLAPAIEQARNDLQPESWTEVWVAQDIADAGFGLEEGRPGRWWGDMQVRVDALQSKGTIALGSDGGTIRWVVVPQDEQKP